MVTATQRAQAPELVDIQCFSFQDSSAGQMPARCKGHVTVKDIGITQWFLTGHFETRRECLQLELCCNFWRQEYQSEVMKKQQCQGGLTEILSATTCHYKLKKLLKVGCNQCICTVINLMIIFSINEEFLKMQGDVLKLLIWSN